MKKICIVLLLSFLIECETTFAQNVVTIDKKQNNTSWWFNGTDNLATIIGYFLLGLGTFLGVWQWRKDESWKRAENLMSRVSDFNETPGAHNAMLMLDWKDRNVPLWDKEKPEERYERVLRAEVALALIPETFIPYKYNPKESAIRDSFDDFLTRLANIYSFIELKLLTIDNASILMNGWIKSIKTMSESKDEYDRALINHFYLYIQWRGFEKIIELFKDYKVDLSSTCSNAENLLEIEIKSGKWKRAGVN